MKKKSERFKTGPVFKILTLTTRVTGMQPGKLLAQVGARIATGRIIAATFRTIRVEVAIEGEVGPSLTQIGVRVRKDVTKTPFKVVTTAPLKVVPKDLFEVKTGRIEVEVTLQMSAYHWIQMPYEPLPHCLGPVTLQFSRPHNCLKLISSLRKFQTISLKVQITAQNFINRDPFYSHRSKRAPSKT